MMADYNELMDGVHPMIMEHYEQCGRPRTNKFNNWAFPPEITEAFGKISEEGESNAEVLKSIEVAFKYSVKTMHPFFMDKLYSGSDPTGQIAELVTTVLNPAVHVYHVSPVFSVMEVEVVKIYAEAFGMDPAVVDGTLNPGGTMGNMMAIMAARQEHFPHVRQQGWNGTEKPIAYTPAQSHYSVNRGAMVMGMGMDNMRQVPCDRWTGQMDTYALSQMIAEDKEKGNHPFFVNCMGGSTVMGSYDDQNAISEITKREGLWHHIDGCWGGFLAWSEKHKDLFAGSEKADSVTMNCHKGQGVPNQGTMLLVNNKGNILSKLTPLEPNIFSTSLNTQSTISETKHCPAEEEAMD
jgi:glutamate/tyrosine decarboxylase-like PLP-dependent enzyme